ncbi:MAG: LysM peptidoglycan-binding domain-containing protein [Spirulina sp. SIO3F2]|nr:LysM peptidoglycan-binding domain-containing protein [Spirulina sp. SIO3F2]
MTLTEVKRQGQPTRAELDTSFVGDIEDAERLKQENKSSPDLTHTRTVVPGDTLPLMAQRIYKDPTYYLKLAQANKINNFRKLKAGRTVNFPPIKD